MIRSSLANEPEVPPDPAMESGPPSRDVQPLILLCALRDLCGETRR